MISLKTVAIEDALDRATIRLGIYTVVHDALLVWTKDSMLWFCCLSLDYYRPSSCFLLLLLCSYLIFLYIVR